MTAVGSARGCAAIILAGGRSSRMGEPKEAIVFEGSALLTRVVERARSFADEVVVVARHAQVLPPCDARVVFDPIDGAGPLVGLLGGLEALAEGRSSAPACELAFVLTTDAPFVSARVARALVNLIDHHEAAIAVLEGRRHVLHAVYRTGVAARAAELVANGVRRASALSEAIDTRWVTEAELEAAGLERADFAAFENVNTPDDLARARRTSRDGG